MNDFMLILLKQGHVQGTSAEEKVDVEVGEWEHRLASHKTFVAAYHEPHTADADWIRLPKKTKKTISNRRVNPDYPHPTWLASL